MTEARVTPLRSSKERTRVLVVEDDATTRKMLVAAIEADDSYKVVAEFGEGMPAQESIKILKPDLILVDLGLPDISGHQIIVDVAATLPQCDILVITTFGDEHSIFSALQAGAHGYLLKGVTADELRRDIKSLRDGGSPLSPSIARKLINKLESSRPDRRGSYMERQILTPRECEILKLIGKGFSYAEAAAHCHVKNETVHAHLKSIYRKLAVHSNIEAVYEARRRNIIQ